MSMASRNSERLRFKDKVAIVTGGCNGIGRGCVDVFVEEGGKVAVLDLDETTGNDLTTEGPGEILFIKCDITDEEQLKKAIVSTHERFGRIDCLVNNAGCNEGLRSVDSISTETFRKCIELLLVAHFVGCREVLPYLRQTKGSIVNITSMSGVAGEAYLADYCSAKGGVAGLTRGLAAEEAKHGVRVNAIAPGPVRTPLLEGYIAAQPPEKGTEQRLKDSSLFRRLGETREVALTCLFLAVDGTFITGEEIQCSGGSAVGYGIKVASF